jgi:hypothetical protein
MIPAGSSEEYNAEKVFMGYRLPSGEMVTVDQMMTAAAEDNHSYYDKTVGATVGKTVGAIPTVGKIPTVGVVGVKTGVTAGKVGVIAGKVGVTAGNIGVKEGMKAASTSMKDTYVHLNGQVLRIPTGAVEQYNNQNEFIGYAMGGEFINA